MAYIALLGIRGVFRVKGFDLVLTADIPQIAVGEDGKRWWLQGNPEVRWATGVEVFDAMEASCTIVQRGRHFGIVGVFNSEDLNHISSLVDTSINLRESVCPPASV